MMTESQKKNNNRKIVFKKIFFPPHTKTIQECSSSFWMITVHSAGIVGRLYTDPEGDEGADSTITKSGNSSPELVLTEERPGDGNSDTNVG